MSNSEDTPTPTPTIEKPVPTTDKNDPKTITSRYEVLGKIGQGGMGKVYTANDVTLYRTVAIKILAYDDFGADQWMRFQREAKAASKLNHPNIIDILDFGQSEQNQPFLVMDFVEGKTLAEVLREEEFLEEDEAIQLINQLCEAMQHAHSNNVIHRDLKPSNIIIQGEKMNRKALILDFGIAKILDDTKQVTTLTKTGEIIGSPRCISPEQALGEKVDQRSDIYSLGCIAFEMLTGKPVFKGENAMDTMIRHINDPAPSIAEVCDQEISQSMVAAIAKALEKEPDKRFQQMSDFKNGLEEPIEVIEHEATGLDDTRPEQKKQKWNVVIAGSILIILIGALGLTAFQKQEKTQKKSANKSTFESAFFPPKQFDASYSKFDRYLKKKSGGYDSTNTVNFHYEESLESQLEKSLKKFPHAKRVWFTKVNFNIKSLNAVKKFKDTNNVKLSICDDISEEAWKDLLGIKNITKLQVEYTKLRKTQIDLLKNNAFIRELSLVDTGLKNSDLKTIATIKNLKHLNISGNPAISIKGLRVFKNFNNLNITISEKNNLTRQEIQDFALSTAGNIQFTITEDKKVNKNKNKN